MKNKIFSKLFCIVFCSALALNSQTTAGGGNSCLDENQVQQAMREEAFRLLTQKIEAVQNETAGGFDFHIEQAYEKIKRRLPTDQLSATELEVWLRQFLQNPKATDNDREFQSLIENFVLGMSLEIINTLQYECEQVKDRIDQVAKLEGEIKKTPHPDQETLDLAFQQSSLSKKMYRIIKNIDRHWKTPAADADNFSAFNILKKNMTGQGADRDQRLVFDLGDRYQPKYPFLNEFIKNYHNLAETFRQAVRSLNALLEDSNAADFKALD